MKRDSKKPILDKYERAARRAFIWRHGILQYGIAGQIMGVPILYHVMYGASLNMFLLPRFWLLVVTCFLVGGLGGWVWGAIMWRLMGQQR